MVGDLAHSYIGYAHAHLNPGGGWDSISTAALDWHILSLNPNWEESG